MGVAEAGCSTGVMLATKRRIGEAAKRRRERRSYLRALANVCRASAGNGGSANAPTNDRSEAGFTLIELLIVVAVMPLIVGALALGTLSGFSLQTSVSNRLTDSGDAQVVSLNFQNDVQSAAMITTSSTPQTTPQSPTVQCGSGYQVL